MRWSLILSTFFTVHSLQSLLSFALVTTQSEITLERRVFGLGNKGKDKDVKAPSRIYRANSFSHQDAYDFSGPSVTRQRIPDGQRQGFFSKMFKGKKYDADHVFEAQMYHDTLQQQGTSHGQLPPALQGEAERIINGPGNMAPVPPTYNRGKGQLVKWGLKGKSLRNGNPLTRSYSLSSYPTARNTAHELDQTFQQHGYGNQGPSFHHTLHNTMTHAGVLTPGQPSPPNSPRRSQSTRQSSRYHSSSVSQPVVPVIPHPHATRQSTRLQRTSSLSQAPPQPVIPMHRSSSTRQSTRLQRTSSQSQAPSHPVIPSGPSRSSSTRQSARLRGQSVSPYHIPSGHASTSYLPQTGPVIPQRTGSRRRP